MMDRYGSIEFGSRSARELANAARGEYEIAFAGAPPGPDLRFIEELVLYMVERDL